MQKVIEEYEKAKEKVDAAKEELWEAEEAVEKLDDGYIYVVCTHVYGSETWNSYTNPLSVQFIADEYPSGDDGIFSLYTNNPKAEQPEHYGGLYKFKIMTTEELKDMAKEDVSMSSAICNWMSKGINI